MAFQSGLAQLLPAEAVAKVVMVEGKAEATIPFMTGAFWPAGVRVHHGAMAEGWLAAIDAVPLKRGVVVVTAVGALELSIGRIVQTEIDQKVEADQSAARTVSDAIRKPGQEKLILRLPLG